MEYTYCHHCGSRLLAGAMRCISCGKILKTPEEQINSVDAVKARHKKLDLWPIIKVALLLMIAFVVYNKFSAQILFYLNRLIGK